MSEHKITLNHHDHQICHIVLCWEFIASDLHLYNANNLCVVVMAGKLSFVSSCNHFSSNKFHFSVTLFFLRDLPLDLWSYFQGGMVVLPSYLLVVVKLQSAMLILFGFSQQPYTFRHCCWWLLRKHITREILRERPVDATSIGIQPFSSHIWRVYRKWKSGINFEYFEHPMIICYGRGYYYLILTLEC